MKNILYVLLICMALYWLSPTFREFINSGKDTWNYIVDYVLTFRYHQPMVWIALPFIAIWLMGKK